MAPDSALIRAYRNWIVDAIERQQLPLPEAARNVKRAVSPDQRDLVELALAELSAEQAQQSALSTAVVNGASYAGNGWYMGPKGGGYWDYYRSKLTESGAPDVEGLGEETDGIVRLLASPYHRNTKRRGLVMGNVQSGKTRNFAGVIAKAADAGYRLVIVLSGINNNLREQTQARLTAQLFGGPGWYPLTVADCDFRPVEKPAELLEHQPVLCAVVKKNERRLQYLIDTLKEIPLELRAQRPVLIIDDEADQATPNSLAEKDALSTINARLRTLWETVCVGSYVAYTATPFANVLMDPDSDDELFPSDFITSIKPGAGYFGAERVFGLGEAEADDVDPEGRSDGLDMVRLISPADAALLRPPSGQGEREAFDPELPGSLDEAFTWFVVATAARRARGDEGHSSMLVHTTHYTDPHFAMQGRFHQLVHQARMAVAGGETSAFRRSWDAESSRVAEEATLPTPDWVQVESHLTPVLEDLEVIVDNGMSTDRLNYEGGRTRTVIAIGGGTLSRGLTLEGLTVSYFTRTSNAYDTLLQMGRWFGYRPGYEDLPRVWVTEGLDDDYAFLARVEKELRDEIESVQGSEATPSEVGVRIRSHPGRLQVTASNKMFHARVVQLGLSGTASQTFIIDGSAAVQDQNVMAVERLIRGYAEGVTPGRSSSPMFTGVSGQRIAKFIGDFKAHEGQTWLFAPGQRQRIGEWILRWAGGDDWNVIVVDTPSSEREGLGKLSYGSVTVRCASRSVLRDSTPEKLNFKNITSPMDRLRDIPASEYASMPVATTAEKQRVRRMKGNGKGLLIVYSISKDSVPLPGRSERVAPPVDHHLTGFAVFFPSVNDEVGDEGAFVSVRATWEVPDTVEGDDELLEEVEDVS